MFYSVQTLKPNTIDLTIARNTLLWVVLVIAVLIASIAIGAAAISPLLAWREPVYIVAGFAGIIAMVLLLFQPLLAIGFLPSLSLLAGRRLHRYVGVSILLAVVIHVVGLWITSPPDVIDALLFVSATPFSIWGVIAMWSVLATACLAALRLRLKLRPRIWRLGHKALAVIIVGGSVTHALMIQGTMETISKIMLSVLVVLATLGALVNLNKLLEKRDRHVTSKR